MRKALVVLVVVTGLALAAQASGTATSEIRSPTAKVEGATLTKWTKRFFLFDGAIPVVDGSHPAIDTGDVDCSLGQTSRKVWFLETSFDLGADVERRCAVPKGTTLYVPVIQWICSPELFDGEPIPDCLAAADFSNVDLSLTVDGATLDDEALQEYRVLTGEFELPLAEDSIWEYAFGLELGDSISFASEAVGALVGPLSLGGHEIVVSYASEEFGFAGSITYALTVVPKTK